MDRYLEVVDVGVTTRARYEGVIRLHVRPLLGKLPVSRLSGETIDAFHAVLRRCREHCDGRPFVVHGGSSAPARRTSAPTSADRTYASRWRPRASERFTSVCPAR